MSGVLWQPGARSTTASGPTAPWTTARPGVPAEVRLCRCGKQRTLPTSAQPRRRRDHLDAKTKLGNSSDQWVRQRGQVSPPPEIQSTGEDLLQKRRLLYLLGLLLTAA